MEAGVPKRERGDGPSVEEPAAPLGPPREGDEPPTATKPQAEPSEPAGALALEQARLELASWRERASKAEERASAEAAKVRDLEMAMTRSRESLAVAQRSRRIDQELFDEGAIDLETARLLAETAAAKEEGADVAQVVRNLRRRKPFLFRPAGFGGSIASARVQAEPPHARDSIEDASEEARTSGDRMALLRYLRMKRGV
jgi:hypothetical protein